MVSIPKQLAEALVYSVHLAEIVRGGEDSMWGLKTVDAVTSDRASVQHRKGKKRARILPRSCTRRWSKGNR